MKRLEIMSHIALCMDQDIKERQITYKNNNNRCMLRSETVEKRYGMHDNNTFLCVYHAYPWRLTQPYGVSAKLLLLVSVYAGLVVLIILTL